MDIYYIQVNAICLIILLIMFFTVKGSRGRGQLTQRTLDALIITTAIMCVSDVVAWFSTGVPGIGMRVVIYVSNMIYYASITFLGYVWLLFVNVRIRVVGKNFRKVCIITAIPFFTMLLLIITDPITGLLFTLDENNEYARASGVFIHWLISYGYLIESTIQTFVALRKAETKSQRKDLLPLLVFIIWPIAGAVFQMLAYGVTATQSGITLGIVLITIRGQQSEITTDALTGLNNRAAFDKFVADKIRGNGQYFSVLMCDVDKFKSINDTFGHAVGDQALRSVAKALRCGCDAVSRGVFLCRFGGDEFVFAVPVDNQDFDPLIDTVDRKLEEQTDMPAGIDGLSISCGSASGFCEKYEDFTRLMARADENMYYVKQAKKAART